MKKVSKRNIYLLLVFVITLLFIVIDKTYAKFPSSYTTSDNIAGLVLDFNIGITNIEEYQEIDVKAGGSKRFNVKITNNMGSDTSYGVWYRMVEPDTINSNIEIGRLKGSSTTTSGTIKNGNNLTVTIVIKNNTTSSIKIDVGVAAPKSGSTEIEYINGKKLITGELPLNSIPDVITKNSLLDTNIDFSKISSDTNGKGVYIRSGTENDDYPIYYYRGDVNNNLIFANMCFKIVRTTETGGIKLIYNGLPTNGQCNATGASAAIGDKEFNSSYNSPTYMGYMYGTIYSYSTSNVLNETYLYGSDVTYSNGQYTLTGTPQTGYSKGIDNYHYTCGSTGKTCTSIKYIYYIGNSTGYYITLSGGKKVETALSEMFDYNTHPSTIKGNKDTTGTIDNWYYTNIEQKGYKNYVEDTVWCNDRSISKLGGWDPNGGSTDSHLCFGAYGRNVSNKTPSLTCERPIDRFTVSSEFGNGSLDYPVGLLTTDEIALAGAVYGTRNSSYYLYSGYYYWSGSPSDFVNNYSIELDVLSTGDLFGGNVNVTHGVRPAISLKHGTKINGGSGTKENPYTILTN